MSITTIGTARTKRRLVLENPPQPPDDGGMEARVAVLEQIAKDTKDVLKEMREDARAFRAEMNAMRDKQERDFRLSIAVTITTALGLAGLMAKGFHWL